MSLIIKGMAPLLQVFDMPTSIRFYRDVLGFEVVSDAGGGDDTDWCLLRRDEVEVMLNTMYEKPDRPPAPDPTRAAAHGDTTLFIGSPDPEGAWRHLVDHGVLAEPPVAQGYGMTQVYLKDPDGYAICFQWPTDS